MASSAANTANQSNGQPLRYGLSARHLVIRDDEHDEFAALQDSLSRELDPQGAIETVIFQELLHAAWNLQRFRRVEADASLGTIADFSDPATTIVLDRLTRYQARAQRACQTAIQELRVLQTNRALRALKLNDQGTAKVPAIVSINDLTKQTRSEITAQALDLALQMTDFEIGDATLKALRKGYGTAPGAPTEPVS